jgi:CheY-like chemotaxis protein
VGDYVLLAVRDDGCGMDGETLEKVFEPFFTTKAVGQGTGLGLAMVYGVVKQNEGYVDIHSRPGRGTSVEIYLPQHTSAAAVDAEAREAVKVEARSRGHETILLVEDEPVVLDMATMMLEECGYRVLAAPTPDQAIHLAKAHAGEVGLLLTDVVMPGMNGHALSVRLTALYPEIRTLFMSGYPGNAIAQHGVEQQGVSFIQKPFTIEALAAKVRGVLDAP